MTDYTPLPTAPPPQHAQHGELLRLCAYICNDCVAYIQSTHRLILLVLNLCLNPTGVLTQAIKEELAISSNNRIAQRTHHPLTSLPQCTMPPTPQWCRHNPTASPFTVPNPPLIYGSLSSLCFVVAVY